MARLIRNTEKIKQARDLIKKALELPGPSDSGASSFAYVAAAKDLLRQARDMVKFIPMSPSASDEVKADAKAVIDEIDQAQKDVIRYL